ncbi:ester cyclase [Diaminobutyricibacter sp. McL0618]|uniref:ester cyclase n=1 Tax=Leifsonia sp. McL0618 TaxID=3415677 RepID=UPI003CF30957
MALSAQAIVDTHNRGLHERDFDLFGSIFADDVAVELPGSSFSGLDSLKGVLGVFTTAFPDIKLTPRQIYGDGEAVAVEQVFTGTHDGPLATPDGEVPPTGRAVTFTMVDAFVLRGGKVVEHRVYYDNHSFLTQLGLLG